MLDREEKRRIWIETSQEAWTKEGAKFRAMRKDAGVTLAEMSTLTGFSACKLGSFERGKPVGTRLVLTKIYRLALAYIAASEAATGGSYVSRIEAGCRRYGRSWSALVVNIPQFIQRLGGQDEMQKL